MDYSPEETNALIQRIADNDPTLTSLNFFACNIGDEKVIALAEALKTNESLQRLYLGYNDAKAGGIAAIAEALKTNKALKEISLEGNDVQDAGAILIAEALKVNNSLEDINLGFSGVKNAGIAAIVEALADNYSLTGFLTRKNEIEITRDNEFALYKLMERNRSIKSISDKIIAGANNSSNPNQFGLNESDCQFITNPEQAGSSLKILEIVCAKLFEAEMSEVRTDATNIVRSVTETSADAAMLKVAAAKAPKLLEQTVGSISLTNPFFSFYSIIKQTDLFDYFRRSGVIKSEARTEGNSLNILSLTKDALHVITSFLGVNDVNFKAVEDAPPPPRNQTTTRIQPTTAPTPTINPQNPTTTATNLTGHGVGDGGCCVIS